MNILCIGSAVLDLNASPIPLQGDWQEKQRIERILLSPGGDAVNQASTLRKCGHTAYLLSAVGEDTNGTVLQAALEEQGIALQYLKRKSGAATGTSLVLVSPDGERHTFSSGGAYRLLTAADLPDPAGFDAVSIASLFQMPALEKDGLAAYLQAARSHGIPTFADLGSDKEHKGRPGISPLLPWIDYFLPSEEDARKMTGAASPEEAALCFRRAGARNVLIKCGAEGCCYLSAEDAGRVPALPLSPVDTTGAGDCMAAVFLSCILRGMKLQEACRTACETASRSTLYPGACGAPAELFRSLQG